MKALTLCADDFAQSPAISDAIVQLIDAGRLSATSVFSESPCWRQQAPTLAYYRDRIDIGLHFNLTHSFGSTVKPLSHWLLQSQLRLLSRQALKTSLLRQIDFFTDAIGQLPDFIDGHQHVHALPIVRDALTDAIAQRWRDNKLPYLRAPDKLGHTADSRIKGIILRLACHSFEDHIRCHRIAAPCWFGGLYSLKAAVDYRTHMQQWLRTCPDNSLMMCHPGSGLADVADPISAARKNEFDYFAGKDFLEDCKTYAIRLTRFLPG
jgi:chitin disaccharide deacetylase